MFVVAYPRGRSGEPLISEEIRSNGELHAREREDLSLHVERCAERYTAVRAEICGLRQQTRRIEGAIWGMVPALVVLGAQILPIPRALALGPKGGRDVRSLCASAAAECISPPSLRRGRRSPRASSRRRTSPMPR